MALALYLGQLRLASGVCQLNLKTQEDGYSQQNRFGFRAK